MDLAAPARVCLESVACVVRRRDSVRKKASRPKAGERKRTSRRQQNVPLRNPGDRLTRHHRRRRQAERIRSCEPRRYGVPLHRAFRSKNIIIQNVFGQNIKFLRNNIGF